MTVYSITQLAAIWERNGGPVTHAVDAVSVALAESGGNSTAVSPSHDYGLWQINSIHFGTLGINSTNWSDINVNARVAVALSGAGTNWAAWCTAWTDPASNCGHGYLPHPQPGSPAADHVLTVAIVLGASGGITAAAASQKGRAAVGDSWKQLNSFMGPHARERYAQLKTIEKRVRGLSP